MELQKNEYGEVVYAEFPVTVTEIEDDKLKRIVEELTEQGLKDLTREFDIRKIIFEGWTVPPEVEIDFAKKTLRVTENGAVLQRNIIPEVENLSGILDIAKSEGLRVLFEGKLDWEHPEKFSIDRIVIGNVEVHTDETVIIAPKKTDPLAKKIKNVFPEFKIVKGDVNARSGDN